MSDTLISPLLSDKERKIERNLERMRREFGDLVCGLLFDEDVVEIMLNDDGQLWVERLGEPMCQVGTMEPIKALGAIKSVAAFWSDFGTEESPIVEGKMPLDGVSRFEGILPPVAAKPVFSIRRHTSRVVTLDEYVSSGILTGWDRDTLCKRIEAHDNIMVSGGTGSGKTTLLNTCISYASEVFPNKRRVILEDTPELKRVAANCVMLRTSPHVSLLGLLKASMRLRPDSLDVGEVRDHAALTLLKAWTTDHPGGFGTIHANKGLIGGILRLEQLVLEAVPTPMQPLIAEAVGMFVNISRTSKGRAITGLIAVDGYDGTQYRVRNLHKESSNS